MLRQNQLRLGGVDADAQFLSDFPVFVAFHHIQVEDRSVAGRQFIEEPKNFLRLHFLHHRGFFAEVYVWVDFFGVLEVVGLSQVHQAFINHDAANPPLKTAVAIVHVNLRQNLEKALYHYILGLRGVVDVAPAHSQHHGCMLLKEQLLRSSILLFAGGYEVFFSQFSEGNSCNLGGFH